MGRQNGDDISTVDQKGVDDSGIYKGISYHYGPKVIFISMLLVEFADF